MNTLNLIPLLAALHAPHVLHAPPALSSPAPIKVVTSLSTYASIAREIVGDKGTVTSIAIGDENPHYVQPKPSFVPTLAQAMPAVKAHRRNTVRLCHIHKTPQFSSTAAWCVSRSIRPR